MKRFLALALSLLMVAALCVSASAYYVENANKNPAKTVMKGYVAPALDGVITPGEYAEVPVAAGDLSYATYDESVVASIDNAKNKLYMSYDEKYVYVAATTSSKNFHNGCDADPTLIWAQYAIQLSFAMKGETDAAKRLEVGYALSSDTNKLLFANWADGTKTGYDAQANKDFIVVKDGDVLVYEVRVPYTAFSTKALAEGDQFLFTIVWATGTSEGGASGKHIHAQLAYGCTGDPGKDVTGHAVMTLGAQLEAPADDTPAADNTADAGIVIAAVVMAMAAGVVLSRKH